MEHINIEQGSLDMFSHIVHGGYVITGNLRLDLDHKPKSSLKIRHLLLREVWAENFT